MTFFLAKLLRPARKTLLSVTISMLAVEALADDWSKDGNFNLSGATSSEEGWVLPITDWKASHAFEKSTAGYALGSDQPVVRLGGGSRIDRLLSLISSAESPRRQYDAYHYSARIPPPALPTKMTVRQILTWIRDTPRQHHAIGRYQIVPDTLHHLVQVERIDLNATFDAALQDRLAKRLLVDAGFNEFLAGEKSADWAMDRIAKVWAGLPMANGKSAYDGYAGNRAVFSREIYSRAFLQIFG